MKSFEGKVVPGPATLAAGLVSLEPQTVAHAQAMFDVLSDPELYRYLDYPPPPSAEYLAERYRDQERRLSPDGRHLWLNWVVRERGGALVGYVQSTVVSPDETWVGYVLASASWGRGFGFDAMRAMLEHVASAHNVTRFLARVEAENVRSVRLLDRLLFRTASPGEAALHRMTSTERLYVRAGLGPLEPAGGS